MMITQQRRDVLINMSPVSYSAKPDNGHWGLTNIATILKAAQTIAEATTDIDFLFNHAVPIIPSNEADIETNFPQDNLEESESVIESSKSIALDHAYLTHGSNLEEDEPESVHDDDETEDDNSKDKENPVREVLLKSIKDQFILRPFPRSNNLLIASFDVACIEEFNLDGSPVDKRSSFYPCGVHGCYDERCKMCELQRSSEPTKVNRKPQARPQVKSRKRKADESLDVSENTENVNEDKLIVIDRYINELSNKKKNKHPLLCKICGKKFTAIASLKTHYRSHGNIKLHACSLCDGTFTRSYGLRYHMQIHNEEYRYTCPECLKKFRHTTHYKAHCRDHRSGKPLQCSLCPSTFKNKNTLNRHVKTKHNGT